MGLRKWSTPIPVHSASSTEPDRALADLFVIEVTRAMIMCDGWGREGALATLKYYGGAGLVLRCPNCDAVVLRLVDTGTTLNLGLRGATRLTVRTPRDASAEAS